MKKNIIQQLLILLCTICSVEVYAQGTATISGTVADEFGPVFGAHVIEIDEGQRIIESTVTDMNGNFALKIRDTRHKIRISYVGCKTQLLSIGQRRQYEVFLQSDAQIEEVVVTAATKVATGGLDMRNVSNPSHSKP